MPARHASSCAASSGCACAKLPAIGGATGLEIGHVAVQDARQLGGGVDPRHHLRVAAVGVARRIRRHVGLGHVRSFPRVALPGCPGDLAFFMIIGPEARKMSRTKFEVHRQAPSRPLLKPY